MMATNVCDSGESRATSGSRLQRYLERPAPETARQVTSVAGVGARAGEIVVLLPNETHAFVAPGSVPLCQIESHVSRSFNTAGLEDRKGEEGNG
jgi:hypothetical protein